MRSIAIVESPLQLICAYEASFKFNSCVDYVIRFNGVGENDRLLLATARFLNIKYFAIEAEVGRFSLKLIFSLIQIMWFFLRKNKYYFCGTYFSGFLKQLDRFIFRHEKYFLDDGVATFLAQKKMREQGSVESIFTFFDVNIEGNQLVVRHSFDAIRSNFESSVRGGSSIFIGQKLVEGSHMTSDVYRKIISKAVLECGGALIYFPHRGESEEALSVVKGILGVQIVRPDLPIELYLLREAISPGFIYSNTSTALFSLSLIFPEAKLVALINQEVQRSTIPHIYDIVDALRKNENVRVVIL